MFERTHKFFHAPEQRSEEAVATGTLMATERANHAPVLCFRIDKARKQRSNRKRIDVARMNAAEQRFGDRGNGRGPKSAPEKRGNGLVLARAVGPNKGFKAATGRGNRRRKAEG